MTQPAHRPRVAAAAPALAPTALSRSPVIPVGPRLAAVLALAYRARRAVLLEGPTGIGKSEIVQQVADQLGISTTILDLSLLEPPDLIGLPLIDRPGGGEPTPRTAYAVPRALPQGGAGILMLEELNRAERYIQQPALQLLTARRIHEYVLPAGWVCFAAINPESGDYQVTPLDHALRARFLNLSVCADRPSWLAWAVHADIHPAVVALARAHDRVFDEVPPRSWTYVSQLLRCLSPAELDDEILLRDALGGYLPPAWCELLLQARETFLQPLAINVPELLARYGPQSEAATMLRRFRDQGQTDRLDEVLHRLLAVLRGPEVGVLAEKNQLLLSSLEALLADLPGDQRERVQEALGRNPTATILMDLRPAEVLNNYRGVAEAKVRSWLADPLRHHRVALLITALCAHLGQAGRAQELRKSTAVRVNLGLLLAQVGERFAMPLVETLVRLGITPVKPP